MIMAIVMPSLSGINTLATHAQGEQGEESTAHQRTRANDSVQLSSPLRNDVQDIARSGAHLVHTMSSVPDTLFLSTPPFHVRH